MLRSCQPKFVELNLRQIIFQNTYSHHHSKRKNCTQVSLIHSPMQRTNFMLIDAWRDFVSKIHIDFAFGKHFRALEIDNATVGVHITSSNHAVVWPIYAHHSSMPAVVLGI
jgi:hypothetical protein